MNASEIYAKWSTLIDQSCAFNKISRATLCGLFEHESEGLETATGDDGLARGLGQMHRDACETVGFIWDKMYDPNEAIPGCAAYLAFCIRKQNNEFLGLMSYNQGPTLIAHWFAGALGADQHESVRRGALYARQVQENSQKWTSTIPTQS